jgi:hypothetical protein
MEASIDVVWVVFEYAVLLDQNSTLTWTVTASVSEVAFDEVAADMQAPASAPSANPLM